MLLVNLNLSYPALSTAALDLPDDPGHPDVAAWHDRLRHATREWWLNLSETYLDTHADYIAGTYEGRVVSVYRVTGWNRAQALDGIVRVSFRCQDAPEAAHLITSPMPGGPWKRGEARSTRAVPTPAEITPERAAEPPALVRERTQRSAALIAERAQQIARLAPNVLDDEDTPTAYTDGDTTWVEHATLGDGTSIYRYPDGTVTVHVPVGTRVLVQHA